jgi:hypothetical protein
MWYGLPARDVHAQDGHATPLIAAPPPCASPPKGEGRVFPALSRGERVSRCIGTGEGSLRPPITNGLRLRRAAPNFHFRFSTFVLSWHLTPDT